MEALPVLFLFFYLSMKGAFADYGLQAGHATFYGGGDASGTMGECLNSTNTSVPREHASTSSGWSCNDN